YQRSCQDQGMRRRPRARWIFFGLFVLAGASLAAVRATRPVDVVAMPVVRGHAVDAIYPTGNVEAEHRVTVKAKIGGPVSVLQAREGDPVHMGGLLARIDTPASSFDLRRGQVEASAASAQAAPHIASTRARIAALEAQLAAAKRELARVHELVATAALA